MMKVKKRQSHYGSIFLIACSVCLPVFYSCVNHDLGVGAQPHPVNCDGATNMHYSDTLENKSVEDIVQANCLLSGCHGDNPDLPDWGNLSELQEHEDEIQRRITLPDSDPDKMPQEGSITQEEREIIFCWIEQGAKDN